MGRSARSPITKVMLQPTRHSVTPRLMADVSHLTANQILYVGYSIVGSHKILRKLLRKHRNVIQMVAGRKDMFSGDAQLTGDFGERGPFIVLGMTEPGVNVISNDRQL